VQRRVQKLVEAGFLSRPTRRQYRTQPIPQAVVWVGWRGILYIAEQNGVRVDPPKNPHSPHQLKRLARELRKHDINWVWQPRWGKLDHDLKVIDFRLAVMEALEEVPDLTLKKWINETVFRADMDEVAYFVADKNGKPEEKKRGVIPDSAFMLANEERRRQNKAFLAIHLLELDMATHSNPSFGRDKVAPYVAYISSPEYRKRFGSNSGRWLVVTTGQRRMRNLMEQTERVAGDAASFFYFTTLDEVEKGNVLVDPIWWQVGVSEPASLFSLRKAGGSAELPRPGAAHAVHP
jgi:hypothetical protein